MKYGLIKKECRIGLVVCCDDILKMKGVMDGAVYQRYFCLNYVDVEGRRRK